MTILLEGAARTYTPFGVRVADGLSRVWAGRGTSPYAGAVAEVERVMGKRGAFLLNHSYEWGCTSVSASDEALGGATLLRTLDWPFDGLGRALVVTRWDGGAGRYSSVTWPGVVGVLTGLAPGRFAAAINQPPLPGGYGRLLGWPLARLQVARSRALSPTHLLRLAFDTCRDFGDAVALIRRTPLCIPAIFTIAGPQVGEAVVIERTADAAFEPMEAVAANHWASVQGENRAGPVGRPRDSSSLERRRVMGKIVAEPPDWSLGWVQAPILKADTRVVVMANPARGRLLVQGWEKTGAVTTVLEVA